MCKYTLKIVQRDITLLTCDEIYGAAVDTMSIFVKECCTTIKTILKLLLLEKPNSDNKGDCSKLWNFEWNTLHIWSYGQQPHIDH